MADSLLFDSMCFFSNSMEGLELNDARYLHA